MSAAFALGGAVLVVDLIDRHYAASQDKHLPSSFPSTLFRLIEGIWTVGLLVFYLAGTGDIKDVGGHVKALSLRNIFRIIIIGSIGLASGIWLEKYTNEHDELVVAAITLLVTMVIEGFIIIKDHTGKNSFLIRILVLISGFSWFGVCALITS